MKITISKVYLFIIISILILVGGVYFATNKNSLLRIEPETTIFPHNKYEKTLIVVSDFDYAPYSFINKNGHISGYDIELINSLANIMKVNVEIKLMSWNEARQAIINGQADMITGLEYKPESLPEFIVSMPFHTDPFVAFGKKPFKKISQLYDHKLAALEYSGSFSMFLNPHHITKNVTSYKTYTEAFESVSNGTNDYVICRYSVGRRAIIKLNDFSIQAVGPTLVNNYFSIGVNNKNIALIEKINAALLQLIQDGTLDTLNAKWLGEYVEVLNIWDFLYINTNVILIVIILLFMGAGILYVFVNQKLVKGMELQKEKLDRVIEYQQLITEATKGLYESIHEYNITANAAVGETTCKFYESMGIAPDTPYSEAIAVFADRYIKKEYAQGYLDTFLPSKVLKAYNEGITNFKYDFLVSMDGQNYYWMLITARVFYWKSDNSVHMISFRQNIDEEKRHELQLMEKAQRDPMTELYNKLATEEIIDKALKHGASNIRQHAFFILDIDYFKGVNDQFGHAFGDFVIKEFVNTFKQQFRSTDIMGRIGGDEFVIFIRDIPNKAWLYKQAQTLVIRLNRKIEQNGKSCTISASIGIALTPEGGASFDDMYKNADTALYMAKRRGKNGFSVFKDTASWNNNASAKKAAPAPAPAPANDTP